MRILYVKSIALSIKNPLKIEVFFRLNKIKYKYPL